MNAALIQAAAAKAAALRPALFPTPITIDGVDVSCACTAAHLAEVLGDGAFSVRRQFVARIPYTALPKRPAEQCHVTRAGLAYRAFEVIDSPLSQEWVITCRSAV